MVERVTAEEFLAQWLGAQCPDDEVRWWTLELWCQAIQGADSYDPDWEGTEDLLDLPLACWQAYLDRISAPAGLAVPSQRR